MMILKNRFPGILFVLFVAVWASPLSAQIKSVTVTGLVTDNTGARIAGVQVTVTNEDTNKATQLLTNDQGEFNAPYLAAGHYSVAFVKQGFRVWKKTGVSADSGQIVRVDAELTVADVSQTVEVHADALQVQTDSTTVQNSIGDQIIAAVPDINHNPFYFASLQPGVGARAGGTGGPGFYDTTSVNSFGIGMDARRGFSALTINGGEAFTNDITLDGVSVQGSAWNEAAVVPNTEGVREVRTLTNNFSAEYGRAQGVVTMTTKSGTNRFHGSVFDRVRNEALNANTYNNNARGISRAPFKVNTYGGTVGGPIHHDRAFFFVSYEGLNHKEGVDYLRTVPTALERKGDFSQTYASIGGQPVPVKIYDPFHVVPSGRPNEFLRPLIPNSIITNPDPFILKLLNYYPMPNRAPSGNPLFNKDNYFNRVLRTYGKNSVNTRIDYYWGKHSIYGTGGFTRGSILTPGSWGDDNPFFSRNEFIGPHLSDNNPYGAIGDTVVLSPTLVLDLRYGLTRINTTNEANLFPNFDYGALGIPAAIQAINAVPGAAPEVRFGLPWSSLNQTDSLHKQEHQTNHDLVFSVTKTRGRWTHKWGGEYRVYLSNYVDANESISIRTDPNYTRQCVTAAGGTCSVSPTPDQAGNGGASLLLGAGQLFISPGRSPRPAFAQKYFAVYSQNDWRATSKLTVNLGLRWDLQPGPTDRFGRISSLDEQATNPFGSQGAIAFAGRNGYSRNLWDTEYGDVGPRVGAAYRLTDSLVVRGGYGITYLPTNTGYFDTPGLYGMDPFSSFTDPKPFGTSPSGVIVGKFNEVNAVVPPIGADPTNPAAYGTAVYSRFLRRDFRNGRVQQWNVFTEKSLGTNWLFSAGYSGSSGAHLPYAKIGVNNAQDLDPALLASWRSAYIATGGVNPGDQQVCNPVQTAQTCSAANPRAASGPLIPFNGVYGNRTVTLLQSLYRYPLFDAGPIETTIGFSDYNAMILQVTRRMAHGLQFNAHYTWSKSLAFGQTEAQTNGFQDTGNFVTDFDRHNLHNNRTLSTSDIPNRFVASFLYELPFGTGKLLDPGNRVLRGVASGWQLAGVAVLQSGPPIQITGCTNSLNGRCDRVPGVPLEVPKDLQRWYDGKTTVTLPSGRQITPCAFCFLKYNPDAFAGRLATDASGNPVFATGGTRYLSDVYWFGNGGLTYSGFRGNALQNFDLTLDRTFHIRERLTADFSARFYNALNHTRFRPNISGSMGGTSTQTLSDPTNKTHILPGQGTNANFGTYTTSTFDPRQVELQLMFRF